MKSCLVFSFRARNSGTKIVKTVVTIGQEAVPIGDETVEQCTEQRPVCIACGFVGTASVPQSVPQGIPFKALQGLAVPLFRHFRRMEGKICKNRKSAEYSKKELPRVPPHEPVSASLISGGLGNPQKEGNPPTKPASRPVCDPVGERAIRDRLSGKCAVDRRKTEAFSRGLTEVFSKSRNTKKK